VVLVAIKKRGPPRRARILSKTPTGVETAAVARKVLKHGAARASRGYPLGRRWPRPVTACPKRDWRKAVLDKTDKNYISYAMTVQNNTAPCHFDERIGGTGETGIEI